jgi:HK97 family phage prohead protease
VSDTRYGRAERGGDWLSLSGQSPPLPRFIRNHNMTTNQIERRASVELRVEGRKLVGRAAPFNTPTQIGDFTETIAPGAFAESIAENRDILMCADHDMSRVLGRTKSGSLRLKETADGLQFELDVPDTQLGRDMLTMAARRDLGGCSIGFHVPPGGDEWRGTHRTLKRIALVEVSLVSSHPSYPTTSVTARSTASAGRSDLERRLALLELGVR